jgi:hypothetical protein
MSVNRAHPAVSAWRDILRRRNAVGNDGPGRLLAHWCGGAPERWQALLAAHDNHPEVIEDALISFWDLDELDEGVRS